MRARVGGFAGLRGVLKNLRDWFCHKRNRGLFLSLQNALFKLESKTKVLGACKTHYLPVIALQTIRIKTWSHYKNSRGRISIFPNFKSIAQRIPIKVRYYKIHKALKIKRARQEQTQLFSGKPLHYLRSPMHSHKRLRKRTLSELRVLFSWFGCFVNAPDAECYLIHFLLRKIGFVLSG